MNDKYFKYRLDENVDFAIGKKEFVTILGNNNDLILKTLLFLIRKGNIFVGEYELNEENLDIIRNNISFVLYKHINIFVGETVSDEIVFSLESQALAKNEIHDLLDKESKKYRLESLLDKDPNSLGSSDKVKMKVLSSLISKPKILVIDNVISELDFNDKNLIIKILKEFVKMGGIVINITNDIEEALYSTRTIIVNDRKLILDDKTNKVLEQTEMLEKYDLSLPFIVELNKKLIDKDIVDKYYLNNKSLVGAIWK